MSLIIQATAAKKSKREKKLIRSKTYWAKFSCLFEIG